MLENIRYVKQMFKAKVERLQAIYFFLSFLFYPKNHYNLSLYVTFSNTFDNL